jgi:hypothetical protein
MEFDLQQKEENLKIILAEFVERIPTQILLSCCIDRYGVIIKCQFSTSAIPAIIKEQSKLKR